MFLHLTLKQRLYAINMLEIQHGETENTEKIVRKKTKLNLCALCISVFKGVCEIYLKK